MRNLHQAHIFTPHSFRPLFRVVVAAIENGVRERVLHGVDSWFLVLQIESTTAHHVALAQLLPKNGRRAGPPIAGPMLPVLLESVDNAVVDHGNGLYLPEQAADQV